MRTEHPRCIFSLHFLTTWMHVSCYWGVINSLDFIVTKSVPETQLVGTHLTRLVHTPPSRHVKKEKCLPVANGEMLPKLIATGIFPWALRAVQMENKAGNILECL